MSVRVVRIVLVNLLLTLVGVAAVLGAGEYYLRKTHSSYDLFDAGYEKPWFRKNPNDLTKVFAVDPDIGFSPILPGPQYDEFGTLRNTYALEKPPGTRRVLFVGDSVTRIGLIVAALREAYGERGREYWNAGVDSFNTTQELLYYKKHNRRIQPDHVVLTFHNNDFETTPIVYVNARGKLVLFSPFLPRGEVNETLFRNSHLYRMYVGKRIARRRDAARAQIVDEVKRSLREFKELLARDGIAFTVLVHPILKPRSEWAPFELENHATALRLLEELGIPHHDLSPPLEAALAEGVDPQWETWKNDKWHPSKEMARRYARYLLERGLLGEPPPPRP